MVFKTVVRATDRCSCTRLLISRSVQGWCCQTSRKTCISNSPSGVKGLAITILPN